jgi:hypothetical protein
MSRPLHILLAGALVATLPTLAAAPAAAQSQPQIQLVDNGWNGGWDNDNWRFRHHHRRHYRSSPSFSFSFGVPYYPRVYYRYERPRDCYREWDGSLYCRTYRY